VLPSNGNAWKARWLLSRTRKVTSWTTSRRPARRGRSRKPLSGATASSRVARERKRRSHLRTELCTLSSSSCSPSSPSSESNRATCLQGRGIAMMLREALGWFRV